MSDATFDSTHPSRGFMDRSTVTAAAINLSSVPATSVFAVLADTMLSMSDVSQWGAPAAEILLVFGNVTAAASALIHSLEGGRNRDNIAVAPIAASKRRKSSLDAAPAG